MKALEKKSFTLRIDPDLFEQYEVEAKKQFRSVNQHLEAVLTNVMDDKKGKKEVSNG